MADQEIVFSKQGRFWFPDSSETTGAFGILSIGADGTTRVSLSQQFNTLTLRHDMHDRFMYAPHRLFGRLEDGRHVFIPEAHIGDSSITPRGYIANKFESQSCLIGDKTFENSTGLNIKSIRFPLGQLLAWFRPAMTTREHDDRKSKLVLPPDFEETYAIDGGEIRVMNDTLISYDFAKREVRTSHIGYLVFEPGSDFSVSDVIDLAKSIEDFIMLFTDQTTSLGWPALQLSDGAPPSDFYYKKMEMPAAEFKYHECWLRYDQVQQAFASFLKKWFMLKATFGPAIYLYAGNRRSASLFTENYFMNCVTGMESLHTKIGKSIPKNLPLEQKLSRVLAALSPSLKPSDQIWAERQIQRCLKPTLADRLQDLIMSLPIKLDAQEVKAFTQRCGQLRNDMSHHGGSRSPDDNYKRFVLELHLKHRALEILYHALLLVQIGTDSELIRLAIYRSFSSARIKYELEAAGLKLREGA